MKIQLALFATACLLSATAQATNAKYQQQLERSGCTQVSEMEGCDISKTKAENAKAGFASAPAAAPAAGSTYTGKWIAKNPESKQTVADIVVDKHNKVTVNGKHVASKLSDGALVFKVEFITYTIQGDPKIQNESSWYSSDSKFGGPISRQ
ncbi:MAG: hypothetical protein K2Y25_02170 [Pseudomonadaceae bacterium]|nr:hypothetical protein [Pseudomonadaceae bacterium]